MESLKDKSIRYRIKERLDRISLGNLGDVKSVGQGVFEIRLAFGAGYRIYYGEEGDSVILLLCGGDKSTQSKDIKKAKAFWQDYLER
jgi:putative addiction module killer protein